LSTKWKGEERARERERERKRDVGRERECRHMGHGRGVL
jgi:hypothetical protein